VIESNVITRKFVDGDNDVWHLMAPGLLSLGGNTNPATWRTWGEVVEIAGELSEVSA
jgi:hypothetical protein